MAIQENSVKVILTRVKQILIRATLAYHVLIFLLQQTYPVIHVDLVRAVSQGMDPNAKVSLIELNQNITLTFGFLRQNQYSYFLGEWSNLKDSWSSTSF